MKILIPLDGSVYSEKAVEYLKTAQLIKKSAPTIYLLNVQKKLPPLAEQKLKSGVADDIYDSKSRAILKPAKKALEEAGFKVKAKVEYGKTADNIVKVAWEIGADMIIMGSHGRTPVQGLLLGSKTSAVLASCKIPLLVIRHGFIRPEGRPQIGVCIDGSPYSSAAIEYIHSRLNFFGQDPIFHLINVITPYSGLIIPEAAAFGGPSMSREEFEEEQREPFDEKIEPLYEELRSKDIETKVVPLKGDPAEEIAKYSTEHNLCLLILGTHGNGSFKAMMMGSTAIRIGAICNRPMLLVHSETDFDVLSQIQRKALKKANKEEKSKNKDGSKSKDKDKDKKTSKSETSEETGKGNEEGKKAEGKDKKASSGPDTVGKKAKYPF